MAATLCIMPLMSCQSARTSPELPPLSFPEFPESDGMEVSEDGRTVTVDADWIVRLAEFRIKYDAVREEYSCLADIYSGGDR